MKTRTYLALIAFLAASAMPLTSLAQAPASNIAVVDIAEVFKAHQRFNDNLELMKQNVEAFKGEVLREQNRLQQMAEELKNYSPNSVDYKNLEQKLTNDSAQLGVWRNQRNRDFLEQEAKLYYDTYVEVSSMIHQLSEERRVSLVLRVSNAETDPSDRQSVLQTVNRNIVYKAPDRDITQEIIARVNRGQTR